jgi:chaperonin cofactor prefoldin
MAEKSESVDELMKKVEEFEKTVLGLLENIKKFKSRLAENKTKFGPDTSKWPTRGEGAE